MNLRVFFELIELKAKTASLFPFLLGTCYSWYHYRSLNLGALLLFFIAMLFYNMFVDIWDNYNDYLHAKEGHDYKEEVNIIGREKLSLKTIRSLLISFILTSSLLGIAVVFLTGIPVLWIGVFCFAVGIFYSAGPKPLSSLPVGEVFSGFTMGFMIVLLSVYINSFQQFNWDWATVLRIFLVALPNTLLIANLMLANNTCDVEEDELNHRYTLVHYIGKKSALRLFVLLIVVSYSAILVGVILSLTPWTMLLNFFTIPFVVKQVKLYLKKQVKSETFQCGVKILALLALTQVICFALGIFI